MTSSQYEINLNTHINALRLLQCAKNSPNSSFDNVLSEFNAAFGDDSEYALGDFKCHHQSASTTSFASSYIRSVFWRLFLNYFGDLSYPVLWIKESIIPHRQHYELLIPQYSIEKPSIPLEEDPDNAELMNDWATYTNSTELCNTILLDLSRTHPSCSFFSHPDTQHHLLNILYLYCREHGEEYRQGMNELAAMLFYIVSYDSLPVSDDIDTTDRSILQSRAIGDDEFTALLPSSCETTSLSTLAASLNTLCPDAGTSDAAVRTRDKSVLKLCLEALLDPRYICHDVYYMFSQLMQSMGQYYSVNSAKKAADQLLTTSGKVSLTGKLSTRSGAVGGSSSSSSSSSSPNSPDSQHDTSSSSPPSSSSSTPSKPTTSTFKQSYHSQRQLRNTTQQSDPPIVLICDYIFSGLLPVYDPNLYRHLASIDLVPTLFLLRWVRLLFSREFTLDEAAVLWDGILAHDNDCELIQYLSIAMLHIRRDVLLQSEDTPTAFQFLLRNAVEDYGDFDQDDDEDNEDEDDVTSTSDVDQAQDQHVEKTTTNIKPKKPPRLYFQVCRRQAVSTQVFKILELSFTMKNNFVQLPKSGKPLSVAELKSISSKHDHIDAKAMLKPVPPLKNDKPSSSSSSKNKYDGYQPSKKSKNPFSTGIFDFMNNLVGPSGKKPQAIPQQQQRRRNGSLMPGSPTVPPPVVPKPPAVAKKTGVLPPAYLEEQALALDQIQSILVSLQSLKSSSNGGSNQHTSIPQNSTSIAAADTDDDAVSSVVPSEGLTDVQISSSLPSGSAPSPAAAPETASTGSTDTTTTAVSLPQTPHNPSNTPNEGSITLTAQQLHDIEAKLSSLQSILETLSTSYVVVDVKDYENALTALSSITQGQKPSTITQPSIYARRHYNAGGIDSATAPLPQAHPGHGLGGQTHSGTPLQSPPPSSSQPGRTAGRATSGPHAATVATSRSDHHVEGLPPSTNSSNSIASGELIISSSSSTSMAVGEYDEMGFVSISLPKPISAGFDSLFVEDFHAIDRKQPTAVASPSPPSNVSANPITAEPRPPSKTDHNSSSHVSAVGTGVTSSVPDTKTQADTQTHSSSIGKGQEISPTPEAAAAAAPYKKPQSNQLGLMFGESDSDDLDDDIFANIPVSAPPPTTPPTADGKVKETTKEETKQQEQQLVPASQTTPHASQASSSASPQQHASSQPPSSDHKPSPAIPTKSSLFDGDDDLFSSKPADLSNQKISARYASLFGDDDGF